jgi:hypothetical protein
VPRFCASPEFEEPTTSQAWTWAKKALGFCVAANDSDWEGMLFLDRLPTEEEAVIIRDKLGIPKKREVSEEERARLAGMGRRFAAREDGVVGESLALESPADDESVS